MESLEEPTLPGRKDVVCTGVRPSSTICWWAHLAKDILHEISQVLFLKMKMNKAVQGHFPCRISLMRQPQGRSPEPSLGPSQELHKLLTQASLAQHFAWAGIGLASAREIFGLNESFWIIFPMDPPYSTHPLLNMYITTDAQHTYYTHSLCLNLSFILDTWGGRGWLNTARCSASSGAGMASAAKRMPETVLRDALR